MYLRIASTLTHMPAQRAAGRDLGLGAVAMALAALGMAVFAYWL